MFRAELADGNPLLEQFQLLCIALEQVELLEHIAPPLVPSGSLGGGVVEYLTAQDHAMQATKTCTI